MENIEKYIPVCECEGEDFMEIPLESDGTLSTATLSAYFPGVTGLKFRLDSYSPYRALRLYDGKFHAPEGSWAGHKFYCVHPKGGFYKVKLHIILYFIYIIVQVIKENLKRLTPPNHLKVITV